MYWGPSYWRFIHYFAMYEERTLVLQIRDFIPCETCKTEWYNPAPDENLLDWSRELHNKVNKKLGRYANWDEVDLNISHKPQCDICEQNEFIHRFPWDFIHEVAKQPNAMHFLKAFNANYPCETHRGTLLDEPMPDEETLAWTVRNHQKVQPNFSLPPPNISGLIIDPVTGLTQPITSGLIIDPVTGFSQPSTTGVPCSSCPGTQVSPVISPDS